MIEPMSTDNFESLPEYFAKPGVVEGLSQAHPVLLVRQMANEISRLKELLLKAERELAERTAQHAKALQHAANLAEQLDTLQSSVAAPPPLDVVKILREAKPYTLGYDTDLPRRIDALLTTAGDKK